MTHLETELEQLKTAVVEMAELAKNQIAKTKNALLNVDVDIAEEVLHHETWMNANELRIDKDCENIFALYNPVAGDLRFVLAMMKINAELERVGDHAAGIANYIQGMTQALPEALIKESRLVEMYDATINMLESIVEALDNNDTNIARKAFKQDKMLNEINKNASTIIATYVQKEVSVVRYALFLFSTIKKLERVGDHIKNIAEEIIFYEEAKVLKHKKKK